MKKVLIIGGIIIAAGAITYFTYSSIKKGKNKGKVDWSSKSATYLYDKSGNVIGSYDAEGRMLVSNEAFKGDVYNNKGVIVSTF